MRQCLIQAYALSHVFPTGFFLEIKLRHRLLLKPCRFHDRITTKQIIPIFPHKVFKGIQEHIDLMI
jgi:hypothetical protein